MLFRACQIISTRLIPFYRLRYALHQDPESEASPKSPGEYCRTCKRVRLRKRQTGNWGPTKPDPENSEPGFGSDRLPDPGRNGQETIPYRGNRPDD